MNQTDKGLSKRNKEILDLSKVLYELQKWNTEEGFWNQYGPPIIGKPEATRLLNKTKDKFKGTVPPEHWRVLPRMVAEHYREGAKHQRRAAKVG